MFVCALVYSIQHRLYRQAWLSSKYCIYTAPAQNQFMTKWWYTEVHPNKDVLDYPDLADCDQSLYRSGSTFIYQHQHIPTYIYNMTDIITYIILHITYSWLYITCIAFLIFSCKVFNLTTTKVNTLLGSPTIIITCVLFKSTWTMRCSSSANKLVRITTCSNILLNFTCIVITWYYNIWML